jgi:hypothetical protein
VGDNRTIVPAYKANALVQTPPHRQSKKKPFNLKDLKDQQEMSACVASSMDEYFAKDKVSNMCTPICVLQNVVQMRNKCLPGDTNYVFIIGIYHS